MYRTATFLRNVETQFLEGSEMGLEAAALAVIDAMSVEAALALRDDLRAAATLVEQRVLAKGATDETGGQS